MKLCRICCITLLAVLLNQTLAASAQLQSAEACDASIGKPSGTPILGVWGFDMISMDKNVRPGDDFYRYAEGTWLKQTQLPAGTSVWGMLDMVQRRTAQQLANIIEETSDTKNRSDEGQRQMKAIYDGFVDVDAMNRRGLAPVQKEVRLVQSLRSHADVARLMGDPSQASLVAVSLNPDAGDRSRIRIALAQGSLGLPGRQYYLKQEEPFVAYRTAYQSYVADMLRAAGLVDADGKAAEIMTLETRLATVQWTPEQLRDSKVNAHQISPAALSRYAPGFQWNELLFSRKVTEEQTIVLQTDTALKEQAGIFASTNVGVWSNYLLFRWMVNHASVLPTPIWDAKFAFYSGVLNGVTVQRPRKDLGLDYLNSRMGGLVGRLYVQRYFSEASLATMREMLDELRAAFAERLQHASWLDDSTRKEAEAKLDALTVRMGYPSHWRSYAGVVMQANDPVGNQDRLAVADWEHSREQLSKPLTSHDWYQNPQTIDATSSKVYNSIEFPAGILQSPFFDPSADPAVNFGSIGAVIGHEMGHNFDDQGSQFDEVGNHRDWWTEETRKEFTQRTTTLIAQYDAYSSVPGMHVNGKQTLGENIGDLTGVVVAYHAYQKFLQQHCK
jgi:putative endopeptidase